MSDLVERLGVWLREWNSDVDLDWRKAPSSEEAASLILDLIDNHGYAVVPLDPDAEMIEEGMHPAQPGSIGDVYREMVKVGRVKA